jgi:hypothetical protein
VFSADAPPILTLLTTLDGKFKLNLSRNLQRLIF